MEKLHEKKNFGMPVTILIVLAYLIGFSLVRSLSGTLLVAVIYAGAAYIFEFDDRIKNAIKHSYIFATYFHLIYIVFEIFESLMNFGGGSNNTNIFLEPNIIRKVLNFFFTSGLRIVHIAVAVIYGLFIILTFFKKDMNMFCVKAVIGEAPPKAKKKPSTYNQPPAQPYGQPPVNQQNQTPPYGQQPTNMQSQTSSDFAYQRPSAPKAPVNQQSQVPQGPVNQQSQVPQGPVNQQSQVPQGPVNQQSQAPQAPVNQQSQAPQRPVNQQSQAPQGPINQQSQAPQGPATPQSIEKSQTHEQKIEGACPSCGNINKSEAKFCASCGFKLI